MENHNNECLHREHLKENPVAIIKPVITALPGRQVGHTKHFQRNNIPAPTKVCIGAKFQLKGKNNRPSKGLYNGSMGKVVNVVFAPGHNPNNGDFPLYIIVSFPQYDGPSFIPDTPNWVPLVSIESRCKFGCCSSFLCNSVMQKQFTHSKARMQVQSHQAGSQIMFIVSFVIQVIDPLKEKIQVFSIPSRDGLQH
jgi:hypothetical protein